MTLTREETEKIVFGTVKTLVDEEGFVVFRRFSDKQYEHLNDMGFQPRQDATAGIFLEVTGDVRRIAFSYRLTKGSSRLYSNLDIAENGTLTETADLMTDTGYGTFSYIPKSHGRLTIWFPNLMMLRIRDLEIDGDYRPGERNRKLLIAGDSITQGYDAAHPSMSYANRITEYFMAESINQSIGGDMYHEENLDRALPFYPDDVIVSYGTNDWRHDAPLAENSDRYLRTLRDIYRNADIFVILPIWRSSAAEVQAKTGIDLAGARELIRLSALKNGCVPIDGSDFVTHDMSRYSDRPALHPNDLGMTEYAEHLIEVLKEVM